MPRAPIVFAGIVLLVFATLIVPAVFTWLSNPGL
jgi:hypothetical protein